MKTPSEAQRVARWKFRQTSLMQARSSFHPCRGPLRAEVLERYLREWDDDPSALEIAKRLSYPLAEVLALLHDMRSNGRVRKTPEGWKLLGGAACKSRI